VSSLTARCVLKRRNARGEFSLQRFLLLLLLLPRALFAPARLPAAELFLTDDPRLAPVLFFAAARFAAGRFLDAVLPPALPFLAAFLPAAFLPADGFAAAVFAAFFVAVFLAVFLAFFAGALAAAACAGAAGFASEAETAGFGG
jgi:hypothetical protein